MDLSVIRRAAIVLAAMQADVRDRVLETFDAGVRVKLQDAMEEAIHRGWDNRILAMELLDSLAAESVEVKCVDEAGLPDILGLAGHLEPCAFARVLQAAGVQNNDFLLAHIAPSDAGEVREELASAPAMSPALCKATLAAARVLLDDIAEVH